MIVVNCNTVKTYLMCRNYILNGFVQIFISIYMSQLVTLNHFYQIWIIKAWLHYTDVVLKNTMRRNPYY